MLSFLVSPKTLEVLWNPDPQFTQLLQQMFHSNSEYPQLVAIKILYEINQRRFKTGGPISNKEQDVDLCADVADFIARRPRKCDEGLHKAILTLYYNLELMPSTFLNLAFNRADIEGTVKLAREIMSGAEDGGAGGAGVQSMARLAEILSKIEDMPTKGNAYLHNKERSNYQPLPKPTLPPRQTAVRKPASRVNEQPIRQAPRRPPSRPQQQHQQQSPPSYVRQRAVKASIADLDVKEICPAAVVGGNSDPEDDQPTRNAGGAGAAAVVKAPTKKVHRNGVFDEKNSQTCQLMEATLDSHIDKDELGKHIVGFLNGGKGGKVVIGVRPSALVTGVHMDRRQRDLFRQGEWKGLSWGTFRFQKLTISLVRPVLRIRQVHGRAYRPAENLPRDHPARIRRAFGLRWRHVLPIEEPSRESSSSSSSL